MPVCKENNKMAWKIIVAFALLGVLSSICLYFFTATHPSADMGLSKEAYIALAVMLCQIPGLYSNTERWKNKSITKSQKVSFVSSILSVAAFLLAIAYSAANRAVALSVATAQPIPMTLYSISEGLFALSMLTSDIKNNT